MKATTEMTDEHEPRRDDTTRTSSQHDTDQTIRAIFRENPCPMALSTVIDGRFVRVNEAFTTITGFSQEDVMNRTSAELGLFEDPAAQKALREKIRINGRVSNAELRLRRKDGIVIDGFFSGERIHCQGQDLFLTVMLDITERKRAEENHTRLITAIEQSTEIIFITDPEGRIQYVNPAFTTVTGYSRAEVLGQNPRMLKSGKQDEAFYQDLWRRITNNLTWKGRFINKRKDGQFYMEEATISPVHDENGAIINYVAVKRDISEHVRLSEQLQQAQKMESVGRLAGGIAHDFNNLLTAMMGYTELCLNAMPPEDPLRKDLDGVMAAGKRAVALTRQLLTFARKGIISPRILDVNETVASMLTLLTRLIGADIEMHWVPGKDLWRVHMDPAQIDQVLANLCVNARDAIDHIGKIVIETRNVTLLPDDLPNSPDACVGEHVLLSVTDDGCGMDEALQSHLFEPFFTTKEQGKGTGLGLATVYGIVRQNRGFIAVQSTPGLGSTFTIYLPRFEGQEEKPPVQQEQRTPMGGNETILLVEDEPSVCETTRRFLQPFGYTVLDACSADQAMQRVAAHSGLISLLIADVIMPEVSGPDLACKIRQRIPEIKCLFISGYTADMIAKRGVLEEGVEFLPKPFSQDDLARRVRKILDS